MTIYEHKASVTTSGGSVSSTSLKIQGGLLRYVLIRSTNANTTFRAALTDEDGNTRYAWGFHTGEIMDNEIVLPVTGNYVLDITNASANDDFTVIFSVQES